MMTEQRKTITKTKGFKFDNNIKGLNAKGGFEIPAGRTININMYTYNGFDGSAKEDACQIQNDSKTTKISEWYVDRYWEQQEHGAEYWGT